MCLRRLSDWVNSQTMFQASSRVGMGAPEEREIVA
jgi:hypothetical protein